MPAQNGPKRLAADEALRRVTACMDKALTVSCGVFAEPFAHLQKAKGKMMRARLGIYTALGPDKRVPADLPPRLAAVELLHLATLAHDDIMDGSDTRRGQPSLPSAFGDKTAVLAGDYLLTRCFSLCLSSGAPTGTDSFYLSLLSKAMAGLCRGEMLQQKNRHNLELTVREYLRIISGKTGALFALAAMTGAATAGYAERERRLFAEFGYRMGMLFQMRDDQIDLRQSAEQAGKSTARDLADGVITLPVILAFRQRPALRITVRDGHIKEALEMIRKNPVDNPVTGLYRQRAGRCLERLQPPGRADLERLLAQADPAGLPS